LSALAERVGLPEDRVLEILRAAGASHASGEQQTFVESDVETFALFKAAAGLFTGEAVLEITRVMGNAMARIAEAAITLFQANVEAPLAESDAAEITLAEANLAGVRSLDLLPRAMNGLFRLHVETAIRRSRHAYNRENPFGSRRLAVGFIDLVGFTPLAQKLGDRELTDLIEEFERRANDIVTQFDGRVVKHIGDEVMYIAVGAAAACHIALAAADGFRGSGVEPHGGLAIGSLLTRGGDFYGPIVNLASRVGDIAIPGEILVTEDVMLGAGEDPDLSFEPAGRRMLKGFADPVPLWTLSRSHPKL
jgi:adenylate cyclase